ncbi:MAG: RagB/SusD family nutrient uptake outer membrane protein [Cytophagaceae bacterium]|nr:RagB/SusD family nutrient uptake outer membrane protein [Cytophagaceae bacterium]
MKIRKSILKIGIVSALLTAVLTVDSCKEKTFLDVTDPDALPTSGFPTRLDDLDLMLIDLYGRMRNGYFNSGLFNKIGILPDHTADQGYNGADFNQYALLTTLPSDGPLGQLWGGHYENVIRCNSFLEAAERIRLTLVTADQKKQLDVLEGQALFIRAMNYFYLVNFFGETMITGEADKAKMGVPLWTSVATDIVSTSKERATIGQNWDLIIADLKKAETLLAGKTWDIANKPRVDIWAVKSFLGKAYVFTQNWAAASTTLKEVVDQSGKKLVTYDVYRTMFNGMNEFNSESIFEVNFTPDRKDVWNNTLNSSTQYGIFISPSFLEDDGKAEGTNGFGNLFVHDENLDRFGFTDNTTATEDMKKPAYFQMSVKLRQEKKVDPRMLVGTLQPWVDSIFVAEKWRKVTKNRSEGFPLTANQAFNHRKYVLLDRSVWSGESESLGNNMYFLRLADVYLLYAEALIRTGNTAGGLEYLNKVRRRAYSQPIDAPSAFDYKTLTDKTTALGAGDHLANDPLKYERWAELFAEGQWWFDVARWKLGEKETAYYKKVKAGTLVWNDRKYAFPIPEREMLNNPKMKQNPGY